MKKKSKRKAEKITSNINKFTSQVPYQNGKRICITISYDKSMKRRRISPARVRTKLISPASIRRIFYYQKLPI